MSFRVEDGSHAGAHPVSSRVGCVRCWVGPFSSRVRAPGVGVGWRAALCGRALGPGRLLPAGSGVAAGVAPSSCLAGALSGWASRLRPSVSRLLRARFSACVLLLFFVFLLVPSRRPFRYLAGCRTLARRPPLFSVVALFFTRRGVRRRPRYQPAGLRAWRRGFVDGLGGVPSALLLSASPRVTVGTDHDTSAFAVRHCAAGGSPSAISLPVLLSLICADGGSPRHFAGRLATSPPHRPPSPPLPPPGLGTGCSADHHDCAADPEPTDHHRPDLQHHDQHRLTVHSPGHRQLPDRHPLHRQQSKRYPCRHDFHANGTTRCSPRTPRHLSAMSTRGAPTPNATIATASRPGPASG